MANQHIGSSFDDFLTEEGLLEECKEKAIKRVLVWQLKKEMQKQYFYVETSCINEKEEDVASSHN